MIRVLVIEDDARIAQMHQYFVEKVEGFEVAGIAQDMAQARELVNLLEPELLLLDLYMPDGNGMDLLHGLRGQGRAVDVILITAAKHVASVQTALRAGAFDYLVKPVIFDRFRQALVRYRKYRRAMDQDQNLEQRDIDQLNPSLHSSLAGEGDHLPKGIDLLTLNKIRKCLDGVGDQGISAEAVGEKIGASRSTARRYLEYMITSRELRADVVYGSVGRPERRYFFCQ